MKIRNFFNAGMLIFLVVPLTACTYISSRLSKSPPTQREHLCSELKRQVIFNKNDLNSNFGNLDAAKQAQAVRMYEKYDCDKSAVVEKSS